MQDKLFIPKKIRVGYQSREDTYTKKLAYVVYYDAKGKLRKEASFEGWRDKKIDVEEFDNIPHSGFVLNKGILRDGYYGNGHNMVRIYDDRGIEFEITVGNLLFILMSTDCLKRGLEGDFVYSWSGKELVLLPVGCTEYKSSIGFTDLQTQKIGIKDLIPGCSYTTKQQQKVIYLGRYNFSEFKGNTYRSKYVESKPQHIFICEDGKTQIKYKYNDSAYYATNSLTFLATKNSDIPVVEYAELMETFSKSNFANKPVELKFVETETAEIDELMKVPSFKEDEYIVPYKNIGCFYKKDKQYIKYYEPNHRFDSHSDWNTGIYKRKNFYVGIEINEIGRYNFENGKLKFESHYDYNEEKYNYPQKRYTIEEIKNMNFGEAFVITDKNQEIHIKQYGV